MSPAPSGSLAHVKLSDALEIRDRIIFDFYPRLPHLYSYHYLNFSLFHQVLARQVREMAGERDHYQSLYDQVRG